VGLGRWAGKRAGRSAPTDVGGYGDTNGSSVATWNVVNLVPPQFRVIPTDSNQFERVVFGTKSVRRQCGVLGDGVFGKGTGDWKVPRTRRLESLRYWNLE